MTGQHPSGYGRTCLEQGSPLGGGLPLESQAPTGRTYVRQLECPTDGRRRARCPRRPRAQPQGHHRPFAAEPPRLHHRAVRLRQVEPCLRHDLRRGAAPLRRVAERVRAPVPADDGEAGRRLDRRPVACDLDRPEDDLPEPALDRRDGDRDLRLPPPALRPRGPAALPGLRPTDRRPEHRVDRRPDPRPARGHALHGQRARRPRPKGRVPRGLRGAAPRRLHTREGGRRPAPARGRHRPRQEAQAHDRGRRRPPRAEARDPDPPLAVRRDRGRARRRPRRGRPRGRGQVGDVQRAVRVPRARRLAPRASASHLLVQLAARRVPALHGPGVAAGDRSRAPRPRPDALDRRGRARPVVGRQRELLRVGDPGDRRPLRDRSRRPVAGPARGAAEPVPLRNRRRPRLRPVPQPNGSPPLVHAHVRGHRRQPPAALQGDRLLLAARADRGVHELPALPGVQGRPAEARGAGGHDRRPQHLRVHPHVGDARARVPRRAVADRDRAADRRAHHQGGPGAPDLPRQRRRRLPPARPGRRHAVRRRGAAAPARDADRLAARRRPLHPRRALDRAAPARQREAHRHARAPPRPRQHRARRRARRADDALGRLARRHGAGGRRARRARRGGGIRGGGRARAGIHDRAVPLPPAADRDPGAAVRRPRQLRRPRRPRAQPEGHRRRVPGREVRLRHGRLRVGQVDARERDRLQGAREQAAADAGEAGRAPRRSRGSTASTR